MRRPKNLGRRGGWYYARLTIDGTLYRRTLETQDFETAKDRLPAVLDEITLKHRQASQPKAETVSTFAPRWFEEWIRQQRNAKGVKLTEQRLRDHIEPTIGSIELAKLTYADLRGLRARLDGSLSPRTVRHVLADVHCMLRYAVDAGELVSAPWRRDLMPRIPEQAPRRLSDEQVELIFLHARPKEALCIQLAVETGLRWGELRSLQWRHVVQDPWPHLVLEGTKSGKVRRVPLTPGAIEAIEGLRKITTSVYVSPYRAVNPCCIAYPIRNRMPEYNRVCWHWHQLRHTFATRYLESGGSLAALQRILGHSTSRMTERYASLSDKAVFADLDRVESNRRSARATTTNADLVIDAGPQINRNHQVSGPLRVATGHNPGPIHGSAPATANGFDT